MLWCVLAACAPAWAAGCSKAITMGTGQWEPYAS
jgi:hypothetical protein